MGEKKQQLGIAFPTQRMSFVYVNMNQSMTTEMIYSQTRKVTRSVFTEKTEKL